ncbi:MAG: hypothetical protein LWX07_01210, partial [Bacteroidetes bacterium]|nr:hypothetical protein [Bacteroidota bacterium]
DVRIWGARILVNVAYLLFAILQFTGLPKFKGTLMSLTVIFLTYVTYSLFVLGVLFYFISFLK